MTKLYFHLLSAGPYALAVAGLLAFGACDEDVGADDRSVALQGFTTDEHEDGDADRVDYGPAAAAEVEGRGFGGANYIPGTPSGFDAESIMLGGGHGIEDGAFSFYDVVALEYLY